MITWPKYFVATLTLVFVFSTTSSMMAAGADKRTTKNVSSPVIVSPVDPSSKDWVEQELLKGRSVVLTNSYLFQVMKGIAQENQKSVEENLLAPLLQETLQGFVKATQDESLRRLFGTPLAILAEEPGVELSAEISKEAQEVKANTMFAPRGHYTDSEVLQRYFIAMQYLAKATIDVDVKKELFPFPETMLFPFESVNAVLKLFQDPANKTLRQNWALIHDFYSDLNGRADAPTFVDLENIAKSSPLTKEAVRNWTQAKGLQRINPERGLGIQPLGERETLHETVIDQVKRKFFSDDTPREKIAETLSFQNLLKGFNISGEQIKGLADRIRSGSGNTYYDTTLRAIAIGGKDWRNNTMRRNFYAASLTSLAEQTALMAKVSILVRKSVEVKKSIPKNAKLYLEPGSSAYLTALATASGSMTGICDKVIKRASIKPEKRLEITDMRSTFERLSKLAGKPREVSLQDPLLKTRLSQVTELARKPAVVVDVFQDKDPSGKMFYYEWAIAPYEADYHKGKTVAGAKGMEMVFFEGWSDEIVPGKEGPLNNLIWESRILEGNLQKIHSIIPVPK